MSDTLIPCPECGAELFDAPETTTHIEQDFEFQGKPGTYEVPAKECPECGEITAL